MCPLGVLGLQFDNILRKMLDGEIGIQCTSTAGTWYLYLPSIPRFRGLFWAWTYFFWQSCAIFEGLFSVALNPIINKDKEFFTSFSSKEFGHCTLIQAEVVQLLCSGSRTLEIQSARDLYMFIAGGTTLAESPLPSPSPWALKPKDLKYSVLSCVIDILTRSYLDG